MKLPRLDSMRLLRIASLAILASLGLMAWGIVDARPLPVVVAMSVGQAVGIAGAALFVLVVVQDLRRLMQRRRGGPGGSADGDAPAEAGKPEA
jgi:heme O synthase-like polyprenyltransferase